MSCDEPKRRRRVSRLWARIKRLLGLGGGGAEPPPEWGSEEPALVPVGPPRRPRPSSAIVLDLPEPDEDIDAYGHPA